MKLQWNVLVKIAQVHYMVAVCLVLRHIKLRKLRASNFLKVKKPVLGEDEDFERFLESVTPTSVKS